MTQGPNRYPDARGKADRARLDVTCRYLGKVFYEGDTICYRRDEWVCAAPGEWRPTGRRCD